MPGCADLLLQGVYRIEDGFGMGNRSLGLKKCLLSRFIDSRPLGLRCLMDMYLEKIVSGSRVGSQAQDP